MKNEVPIFSSFKELKPQQTQTQRHRNAQLTKNITFPHTRIVKKY